MKKSFVKLLAISALLFAIPSCATHIAKPKNSPQNTKTKFGSFSKVEFKEAVLAPKFAQSGANKKAAKKINELLARDIKTVFPNAELVDADANFSKGKVLQITPLIEEIKFISGAARFWIGAMAGSSAILMKVTYVNGANGEIIAEPEFYRAPGAYSGAATWGVADNRMLINIVDDVVKYSANNK